MTGAEAVAAGCARSPAHAHTLERIAVRVGVDPSVVFGAFGKLGLADADALGHKILTRACPGGRVPQDTDVDAINDRILLAIVAAAEAAS